MKLDEPFSSITQLLMQMTPSMTSKKIIASVQTQPAKYAQKLNSTTTLQALFHLKQQRITCLNVASKTIRKQLYETIWTQKIVSTETLPNSNEKSMKTK